MQKLLSSKEGSESDRLHSRWSKGTIYKQIDQLLSGAPVSSPSQFGPEYALEESDDILKDLFPARDGFSHGSNGIVRQSRDSAPSTVTPVMPKASIPDFSAVPVDDTIRLPADFWRLLDVYYSFTHSWLPISEKHDMLKTAYTYPLEGLRIHPSDVGSGNHAELWAILSLAAHQISPRKQQDEIDMCMTTAKKLLPEESGPFELGHVRALILLSLIYIGRGDRTPAWMLIGRAIRIAYDLRLHEQADMHVPRRKHVILACYLVEAILGRLYSMPCHLKGQGSHGSQQLEEDGLEEWNPWDGGSNVTSQQRFGLSRKPAQTLSMFNKLLRALRDDESGGNKATAPQKQPEPLDRRRSTISSSQSRPSLQGSESMDRINDGGNPEAKGSTEDSEPWSPQQLHYEVITLWLKTERNLLGGSDIWPAFTAKLKAYIHCFGASKVPPTAVPLIERLLSLLDLDARDMSLRNMISSLPHVWRQEVPIQAIAFQTTPGQDASPASMLGEPLGPIHRHSLGGNSQSSHTMGVPSYYNGNNFGVVPGMYRGFPAGQDPMTSQPPAYPPQSNLANQSSMMPPIMPQQQTSSSMPPMDYLPNEQNQTADLEAIFEEIAVLDGKRSNGDRPEFMRNLGLGPDLDLSAFFGADYQPSDPLFSYLQPDSFGHDGNSNNMFPGS